jgi:diguanylate cyclase (GGDEF)-like protein/PAS domain S-box-containing protein
VVYEPTDQLTKDPAVDGPWPQDVRGLVTDAASVTGPVLDVAGLGEPVTWAPEIFAALVGEWSPDVTALIDPELTVRYAGRSIERVLGLDPATAVGAPLWDYVHPEDLVAATGAMNETNRSTGYHHPTEFRVRHADGGWVDCEVNANSVDGPDGPWLVLSIRATRDRDQVIGRRRQIEKLINMASLECSAARWSEVDPLVERFLDDLAGVVGAEMVELAWEEATGDLRVGGRWPALRSGRELPSGGERFVPLWPIEESAALLLRFSTELDQLGPSPVRDRLLTLGTRAVVELPLSPRAPWGVVRLAFGDGWRQWDDANVDLIMVLLNTLMATLRRCRAEAHLQLQARTDPLTGLLNRSELYDRFEALLDGRSSGARAGDAGSLGVLYGDLDLFKEVNDRFGHAAGDELLVQVAKVLRDSVREVDLVARFGGDEFVVVCPDLESPEALTRIMARASRAVSELDARGIPVRMSLGAALATPGLGADEVVRLADEAMYRAKRSRGHLRSQV